MMSSVYKMVLFSVRHSRSYWVYYKKHEKLTINPPISIYINRINNKLVFKIKDEYNLELQLPETMKLLGSTKLLKTKNGENVPSREVV